MVMRIMTIVAVLINAFRKLSKHDNMVFYVRIMIHDHSLLYEDCNLQSWIWSFSRSSHKVYVAILKNSYKVTVPKSQSQSKLQSQFSQNHSRSSEHFQMRSQLKVKMEVF